MRALYFAPAVLWFIISIILLTLPASDLPHRGLFDVPYFDKYVHLLMFFVLTTLFCLPFSATAYKRSDVTAVFNKIAFSIISYGIIMEFIQKFLTTGRSFDVFDILFDTLGCLLGLLAVRQYAAKK